MEAIEIGMAYRERMSQCFKQRFGAKHNNKISSSETPPSKETRVEPLPVTETGADMLTIREAAEHASVNERTIRHWLNTNTGDGPMLKGVRGKGRLTRIPRCALVPYRKAAKAVRPKLKTAKSQVVRKNGKRK